jgi:hypothetical protein
MTPAESPEWLTRYAWKQRSEKLKNASVLYALKFETTEDEGRKIYDRFSRVFIEVEIFKIIEGIK